MPLKREVGGSALYSHGNYIIDCGKSWKNHEIVFFNFCRNSVQGLHRLEKYLNLEGFLEKSFKIKSALKSTGKSLKSLERP